MLSDLYSFLSGNNNVYIQAPIIHIKLFQSFQPGQASWVLTASEYTGLKDLWIKVGVG